jgi:predicted transglutaminase-like cysteine proteinase
MKTVGTFILILIFLVVALPLIACDTEIKTKAPIMLSPQESAYHLMPICLAEAVLQTEKIKLNHTWDYKDIVWKWELRIPVSLYTQYSTMPRLNYQDISYYVSYPEDDRALARLASEISRISQKFNFSERDTVEFASAFVQSLSYETDISGTGYSDYPKFPIETLVEQAGDCEDSAILLSSLLTQLGFDTVMLYFPRTSGRGAHWSLGVSVRGAYGTNWEMGGTRYYHIETTTENWKIGAITGIMSGVEPTIFPILPMPFIEYEWQSIKVGDKTIVKVNLLNVGEAPAEDIYVLAQISTAPDLSDLGTTDQSLSLKSEHFTLIPNESIEIVFEIEQSFLEEDAILQIRIITHDATILP